jgi:RimJ/RimL family protein N-acetyltransferase
MAYPYSSPSLTYRAIRPIDIALFNLITADTLGFINSNYSNIAFATESDTASFMKHCAEKCLMGAVIWLNHPADHTKEQIKDLIEAAKKEGKEGLVEEYGTAIGEIHLRRLAPQHAHHRSTEIGIDIIPEFQGKGYGGEAIKWSLDYAFRRAGLHRVKIRAFEWNAGALRLYERLGFVHEGREREACWHEGRFWDSVDMGILEGEWRALQSKEARKQEKGEEAEVVVDNSLW